MALYYQVIGSDTTQIWGLSPKRRIARVLSRLCGARETIRPLIDAPKPLPENARLLLIRADYLLDERVIDGLIKSTEDLVLEVDGIPVAAWVDANLGASAKALLENQIAEPLIIRRVTPEDVSRAISRKLRKVSPPYVIQIRPEKVREIEHHLFIESYKGVTDLVTKWLWPKPAEQVVRFCANHGIRPNHVTTLSWVLAIAVGFLFYYGHFALGLVLGWTMTFLDTVDGKLARVTVDSSRFGHFFDHILDLFHPPFWYLAWGLGLASYQPLLLKLSVMGTFWLLLAGYIGGRVAEGVFKELVAGFSIFTWEVMDSINRLITARRNPCLILLTLSLVISRPDLGYEAVTLWTLVSTAFLWWRLLLAVYRKFKGESLTSWLDNVDPKSAQGSQRWFVSTSD
ncbi:MAG: hypothetical protein AXA67_09520 [Methylothermaceae bacteria B42]|nr:MAG: hypothetical protein AXA67_09520 [Methylothermaceae bacteria B42]HHJ39543.1 CDP-alcohol phosphatidyltransferase family protein [Methylothermaceae bacterium]